MIIKPKRELGVRGEKKSKKLFGTYLSTGRVMRVDPGVSALRIIKKCSAGISFPFTSTALYVKALGLPSIYYDPIGWIQPDDEAAHGIEIVTGLKRLREWARVTLRQEAEKNSLRTQP